MEQNRITQQSSVLQEDSPNHRPRVGNIWNKVVAFPTGSARQWRVKNHLKSQVQGIFFPTVHLQRCHTSSNLPRQVEPVSEAQAPYSKRQKLRTVFCIARDILQDLQSGKLDHKTFLTFKPKRMRLTNYEKHLLWQTCGGSPENEYRRPLNLTVAQIRQSQKDKITRMKVKVWAVAKKTKQERKQLLSSYWQNRFDILEEQILDCPE